MISVLTVVPPDRPLRGRVTPPGSKSITNRALLLAALAHGTSRFTGALKSDDTRHMANALTAMGVLVKEPDDTSFVITGTARLTVPAAALSLGNAGTATRFLTAAAALAEGPVVVTGDANMQRRPIGPLVSALRSLGITIEAPSGCPPVTIQGQGGFDGGIVTIDARLSSQYASALLMLAPAAREPVEVLLEGNEIGARGYIDLTCAVMRRFGAQVEQTDHARWKVQPGSYRAVELHVEPDASAATYLWAAAALTGGVIDIGIAPEAFTQPDAAAYDLIRRFPYLPSVIDGSQIQDAVPTLAALAAFNTLPVRFVGIANLRVKECDRITAMATELSRLSPGLAVQEGDDLLITPTPPDQFCPAQIQTYSDHRIAMSMALVGLRTDGVSIIDPDCVHKTYPRFWQDIASLGVVMNPSSIA